MFCARNGVWGKWGKGVEKFPNIVWNILGIGVWHVYSMPYFFILL